VVTGLTLPAGSSAIAFSVLVVLLLTRSTDRWLVAVGVLPSSV
jgi:hypothetical protein